MFYFLNNTVADPDGRTV